MRATLVRAARKYISLEEGALRSLAQREWVLNNGHLQKTFSQPSHSAAAKLALDAAKAADALNHHAEIRIKYKKLTFLLRSNDAGSVSNYDAKLAATIDELANDKPANA